MANDLRIQITGALDITKSVSQINQDLRNIESKINKLKINVEINDQATGALNALNSQIRNLNNNNVNNSTQALSSNLNNVANAAHNAHQQTLTFTSALTQGIKAFSLWVGIAQIIYAPIRALEDMSQRLIQIDTQMTEIKRVMDEPDFKFAQMLQDAVNTSDQLSSKLTDVLSIMSDFGRMGFNDSQLTDITKTAQVLQNISDLNASDSVDTLTSAMLNFNIASSDSIKIADKLNEVDNKYAITSQDLADSIRKAAATAKTFGVTLDELNGYTAAIGRQNTAA